MSNTTKPTADDRCIEYGKPIDDEPFFYTKQRACSPVFIHCECYEQLPKVGDRKETPNA